MISEEDFEHEATRFLEANASRRVEISSGWGEGSDEVSLLPEKNAAAGARRAPSGQNLGRHQVRRRVRLDHRARGARRTGRYHAATRGLYDALEAKFDTAPHDGLRNRSRHGRPDDPCSRHRTGPKEVPASDVPRGHRGLPALQRAGRRKRSRIGTGESDQGRRRMDRHGPEGLDLGRAPVGHRRDRLQDRPRPAQAQGHHRFRGRHARPGGGDEAAAPDDGRGIFQRGLLQRGEDPRLPPARGRERRMDRRPHDAHERARGDRWRSDLGRRRLRVPSD